MTDRLILQVGETGYYRVLGEYYPARVIATGIRQCFGSVDEVIVYTKHGWQDVVKRTTAGWCSFDGSGWVSAEDYKHIRAGHRERVLANFEAKMPT